jgi:hypothetical protein
MPLRISIADGRFTFNSMRQQHPDDMEIIRLRLHAAGFDSGRSPSFSLTRLRRFG